MSSLRDDISKYTRIQYDTVHKTVPEILSLEKMYGQCYPLRCRAFKFLKQALKVFAFRTCRDGCTVFFIFLTDIRRSRIVLCTCTACCTAGMVVLYGGYQADMYGCTVVIIYMYDNLAKGAVRHGIDGITDTAG